MVSTLSGALYCGPVTGAGQGILAIKQILNWTGRWGRIPPLLSTWQALSLGIFSKTRVRPQRGIYQCRHHLHVLTSSCSSNCSRARCIMDAQRDEFLKKFVIGPARSRYAAAGCCAVPRRPRSGRCHGIGISDGQAVIVKPALSAGAAGDPIGMAGRS